MVAFKLPPYGKALANTATVSKSRKPKFDLHLKIYDLNNVPLVAGTSMIKWHLPHSIHSEHRGRTHRCPVHNHRVEYAYSKLIPLRIAIDRANNLSECTIEFEVLQEIDSGSGGGREEKIILGKVAINLAEYVEESEAILRDTSGRDSFGDGGPKLAHVRKRSSLAREGIDLAAPPASVGSADDVVEEGVVRRYLMQESKVNSTLKLGILMVQTDGERNFVAPPLKTAPVFGGIAGIIGDAVDPASDEGGGGTASATSALPASALSKGSRDASELQDMYRRALAASWACHGSEMPADECIEHIFSGGSDVRDAHNWPHLHHHHHSSYSRRTPTRSGGSGFDSDESPDASTSGADMVGGATLRPEDARAFRRGSPHHRHQRSPSGSSAHGGLGGGSPRRHHSRSHSGESEGTVVGPRRVLPQKSREDLDLAARNRSDSLKSLASLASTIGSERAREGFRRARELDEGEVRDDLVAWRLPGTVS